MPTKRNVEIFDARCPACAEAIELVRKVACPSCSIRAIDTNEPAVAERARKLGVRAVPAVAVNGRLLSCCEGRTIDQAALKEAGVGQPVE